MYKKWSNKYFNTTVICYLMLKIFIFLTSKTKTICCLEQQSKSYVFQWTIYRARRNRNQRVYSSRSTELTLVVDNWITGGWSEFFFFFFSSHPRLNGYWLETAFRSEIRFHEWIAFYPPMVSMKREQKYGELKWSCWSVEKIFTIRFAPISCQGSAFE